ncbi:GNAT family N-acetyltransferase [Marivirga harenae]|uniref:GNAT family N-acetyltransferase n=1 Tax=Marivirga harenae TaxID=2010992 RepID=UPI0026E01DC0|nr:GNAT family N-acetyltransferase [Marivirga harenae]WKV12510.1 GNAT family N-acetyltransferase [Marivirga harenae]|tara:strand:+ start:7040 stop:7516 length:477 start_codon:yes stop_codon:yes gene_type:complete
MSVTIRKATEKDIPRTLELIQELAVYEREPEAVVVDVDELIKDGFGDNPAYGLFVAETEKEIVGIALYYFRYSTWNGKVMYLEDLVVTESERGNGYGRKLLNAILKEADEQNCRLCTWQVLDWNEPSIEFYKAIGADLDEGWINCTVKRDQYKGIYKS